MLKLYVVMVCRHEEPGITFQLVTDGIGVTPTKRIVENARDEKLKQAQFCLNKSEKCILYQPIKLKVKTNLKESESEFFIYRCKPGKLSEDFDSTK